MNDRIQRLIAAARAGDIYPAMVPVEYNAFDENLSDPQRIAKRLTEYMAAQPCAFTDDESFEKLVALIETYFREGGLHIQLNHVSAEELRAAKANPDAYKSLRVRVSGFSAYFVGLKESIQDDVIARTEHKA